MLLGRLKRHYYYGQHTTSDLNDGYAGSGTILHKYYKKYKAIEGETYIKEIIQFYNNLDELNLAEYELIGDKYETDPLCLNLRAGGSQPGMSYNTIKKLSKAQQDNWKDENYRKKQCKAISVGSNRPETKQKQREKALGRKTSEETKQKQREKMIGHKHFLGHHHTEETKNDMSEHRKHLIWIHIGDIVKRVEDEYIYYWLDDGWKLGKKDKIIKDKNYKSMLGKHHKEKSKKKMSDAKKGRHWFIDINTNKRKWV